MSTNEQPESFSAALHEAALSIDTPPSAALYGDAVRYGRRIKRRRAIGSGLTAAVAVVAAGALAFGLTGSGAGTGAPAVTVPVATAPDGTVTEQYMVDALASVLPSNAKIDESVSAEPSHGSAYAVAGSDGSWGAVAQLSVRASGSTYLLKVEIMQGTAQLPTCPSYAPGEQGPACDAGTAEGGTFGYASAAALSSYAWNLSARQSIVVTVRSTASSANGTTSPFTANQIEQLVSAKVWTKVLRDLPTPVNCSRLLPTNPEATGWKCMSTGKTYPGIGNFG